MIREILYRIVRAGNAPRMTRGWRCPDETSLAAFIDAPVGEQARARILDHLKDCRYCRDQIAAALRVQTGEVPGKVPPELLARARFLSERKESGRGSPVLRWGAIAAAAASIALVVTVTHRRPDSVPALPTVHPIATPKVGPAPLAPPPVAAEPPSIRNRQNASAAPDLLDPREGGVVSSHGMEFRWKPVPAALSYEVRVVTEEGDVVWEGRAEDSHIKLPSTIHLAAAESFFVRVRAFLPEGKTISSKVVGFRVKNSN